jgi:2-methylcitrate dehydratase PrpD
VLLKDGQKIVRDSDEAYRGGPDNPLSDKELQAKFTDCSEKIFEPNTRNAIFETTAGLENIRDLRELISLLSPKH